MKSSLPREQWVILQKAIKKAIKNIEWLDCLCYTTGMKGEMKIVGRRKPSASGLEYADNLLKTVVELRRGRPLFPRGVYRFKSFEEADAWSLQMVARPSPERPR